MFVVQQANDHSHIDKFPMYGGEPHIHVIEDDLGIGSFSIVVDEKNKAVYWADSHVGKIERMLYDGDARDDLYTKIKSPVSLALLEQEVYWIGENSKTLYMGTKYNSTGVKKIQMEIPDSIMRPFNMELAAIGTGKVSSHKCMQANGGCSHICVSNGPTTRVCLCPVGMIFKNDENTTCREPRRCEFR